MVQRMVDNGGEYENADADQMNVETGSDAKVSPELEGYNSLVQMWGTVEEANDYAQRHLQWDLGSLTSLKGHIPGLRLLQPGEVETSEVLDPDIAVGTVKSLRDIKSGKTDGFELPRVALDSWDEINGAKFLFEQMPGYIETNAAILLRALYEALLGDRAKIEQSQDAVSREFENARQELIRLGVLNHDGVLNVVSGVRDKPLGLIHKIGPFLNELLDGEPDVRDRREEHLMWNSDISKVFDLLNYMSAITSGERFQECLRVGGTMTNMLAPYKKENAENLRDKNSRLSEIERMLGEGINDEELVAGLIEEMKNLTVQIEELNDETRVYRACSEILDMYSKVIYGDQSIIGKGEAVFSKWSAERVKGERYVQEKMADVHVMGLEKRITELIAYLTMWPDLNEELRLFTEYDLAMLGCDREVLKILRKFESDAVFSDEDAAMMRERLGDLRLLRKMLEMKKKLVFEAEDMSHEERWRLEWDVEIVEIYRSLIGRDSFIYPDDEEGQSNKDAEILRVYRKYAAVRPVQSDQERLSVEFDGANLLLTRRLEILKKRLAENKDEMSAEQFRAYELDIRVAEIELEVMAIERDLKWFKHSGEAGFDVASEVRDLQVRRRKLQNDRGILEIDSQLEVSSRTLRSGVEKKRMRDDKNALIYENELIDSIGVYQESLVQLDSSILDVDEKIGAVLYCARELRDFCERLRVMGSELVSQVDKGNYFFERKSESESELDGMEEEMAKLNQANAETNSDILAFAKMILQKQKEVTSLEESGRQNANAYKEIKISIEALKKHVEELKVRNGEEKEQINNVRNRMRSLVKALGHINMNINQVYERTMQLLGGNSLDVGTYRYVVGFGVKTLLTKAWSLHDQTGELMAHLAGELIEEIKEGHAERRLSDPGTPAAVHVVDKNFKPTMKVQTGLTMGPATSAGNRSLEEMAESSRRRVSIVELPQSYRHTFNAAVHDVVFGDKKSKD